MTTEESKEVRSKWLPEKGHLCINISHVCSSRFGLDSPLWTKAWAGLQACLGLNTSERVSFCNVLWLICCCSSKCLQRLHTDLTTSAFWYLWVSHLLRDTQDSLSTEINVFSVIRRCASMEQSAIRLLHRMIKATIRSPTVLHSNLPGSLLTEYTWSCDRNSPSHTRIIRVKDIFEALQLPWTTLKVTLLLSCSITRWEG